MKFKYLYLFVLICTIEFGCKKDTTPVKNCTEINMNGFTYVGKTKTLIPLNQQNFWIYDDSVYNSQNKIMDLRSNNFIMYIESFSKIDEQYILYFNQFMPPISVFGDSIFSAISTPEFDKPNCYEYKPFLFKVADTAYLNEERTSKLYPAVGQIQTKLGNISYNYIYNNGNSLYEYINDSIGIIRYEFKNSDSTFIRTMTINNFEIK